ncbi:MAG: CDGSH iron-sulfur domain-containing protein [Mariprofundus sp.]|nr:CDGSH iron-sulfur domain-containing protein [Mariprofundus sp.]
MSEATIAAKVPMLMTLEPGTYYWCACGKSAKQPFCDGSHKGSDFAPVAFEITEKKTVALCLCKHTNNAPFCDGTHTDLV